MASEFRISKRPPEVEANPEAFKWVDGAWLHVADWGEYLSSNTKKDRDAITKRWPE